MIKCYYIFSLWLSDQVENSSIITLIGLDMNTAYSWKIYKVYKKQSLVQIYNLIEYQRKYYPSLIYTSDFRYSLYDFPIVNKDRSKIWANHTKYTSGKATIAQPLHEYIVIKKQLANHSYLNLYT